MLVHSSNCRSLRLFLQSRGNMIFLSRVYTLYISKKPFFLRNIFLTRVSKWVNIYSKDSWNIDDRKNKTTFIFKNSGERKALKSLSLNWNLIFIEMKKESKKFIIIIFNLSRLWNALRTQGWCFNYRSTRFYCSFTAHVNYLDVLKLNGH